MATTAATTTATTPAVRTGATPTPTGVGAGAATAIVFLNGEFVPPSEAKVSVFDRGFLFGDGVYEFVRYFEGRAFAIERHVARLTRSLREARISGFDPARIAVLGEVLLARNGLKDAGVYWQITRGCAGSRVHLPPVGLIPTVFACAEPTPGLDRCLRPTELAAITRPDERWARVDIKSINLLPNVLGKLAAADEGAQEVIFHRSALVSEGASTNVIVAHGSRLRTPPINDPEVSILHGVTRRLLLDLPDLRLEEHPITLDELRAADEILVTGTRTLVGAVTRLDGKAVGQGEVGPVATAVLRRFIDHARGRVVSG